MNSIPVLKSKLIMPELSVSFLLTDRMKRLHKDMDSCRAAAVCAPAGYGKTTLAVSYFARQVAVPFRVCWYRLDPEDKNISVFIAHLSEAIFPLGTDDFAESRKAVEDYGDIQTQPHHAISMICHEMWVHHSRPGYPRTYIVLDDFQNVAQIQDICDMIRYMLDNLPPSCSIFILNRSSHNVFTEKQKLEKKVLEIGMDDLAFNNAEIEHLLLIMGQTAPDRRLTDIIEENTEGWIAGIIILYQAVRNRSLYSASIELGKLGQEDALFRYMSLEVLKSVQRDIQYALARLSLLEDFSEAEAAEILEIDDIKSLMTHCLGFGMFVQKIPGDPVVYRFHSLFREFLLYVLKDHYPEKRLTELHLKAAGYYMDHNAYGRAAEQLVKCGNSTLAMDIVVKAGFNKFMIGETGQLKLWLDLLPEGMIRENPVLLLFKAQLMPNSRQPEMVEPLKRLLHQSLLNNNIQAYYDVASVLVYILMCSNDMKGLREITAGLPKELQNLSAELENTLSILDVVHLIGKERFSEAAEKSESIVYALLPEDSQWLYLILSCIVYFCLGRLEQGERCMETALSLCKFKNIEPSRGFILLFLSTVMVLKNEMANLPSYIEEVLIIGEKYSYEYLSAHGKRLAAFERYLSLEAEASVELLDYAVFYFLKMGNKAMAAACTLLRRLWSIDRSASAPDLEDALKELSLIRKASPGLMVYESSLSIIGAIAREAGDFPLAEHSLLSSIKAAKAKKGYQVLCGSCFHIASLYYSCGNTEQGHRYLKQAMELASANRYFMFWDIHIPTLIEMVLRGMRYNYCTVYAEELLSRFYDGMTVKYLSEKVKYMDESLITAFVRNFVSTYRADKAAQLYLVKASLFGKLEISINGIKILDTEWKTKKVKGFLEFLLLNSGNTISKDLMAEILWPGSDGKSAAASQRTALYYLRKILSKYDVEVAGSNAFIYETLEGLQIRRNDALELDIHEFSSLYEELSLHTGNTPQAEQKQSELLERMVHIYKGDLLEGSDHGDLVIHERERFKTVFIEACQKLSKIYAGRGELSHAEGLLRRALAAEPYNENVCLELLKLYMSQGRKSKAVKLYYSFKNRLEQELDIKVDKSLTEAIRSPGPQR